MCDAVSTHFETHKREMKELYPDVEVVTKVLDVSKEDDVKAVCEEAIQRFGRLDVMFANAGM